MTIELQQAGRAEAEAAELLTQQQTPTPVPVQAAAEPSDGLVEGLPSLPPRPPVRECHSGPSQLTRWGIQWNGPEQSIAVPMSDGYWTPWHIADELLRQALANAPVPVPVAVSERLPHPNVKVLAHYVNDHGNGRTICAIWVPAGSRECDGDDSFSEPDDGCWPEGWYEQIENLDDYGWIAVNEGDVAYWQPLPKWPAYAPPVHSTGDVRDVKP